jgi:hypothetical protein
MDETITPTELADIRQGLRDGLKKPESKTAMDELFTTTELTSFGSYLLSRERSEGIFNTAGDGDFLQLLSQVHHSDFENWKALHGEAGVAIVEEAGAEPYPEKDKGFLVGYCKSLIEEQDRYIDLLAKEIDSMSGVALAHRWESDLIEGGRRLREMIQHLKSKVAVRELVEDTSSEAQRIAAMLKKRKASGEWGFGDMELCLQDSRAAAVIYANGWDAPSVTSEGPSQKPEKPRTIVLVDTPLVL